MLSRLHQSKFRSITARLRKRKSGDVFQRTERLRGNAGPEITIHICKTHTKKEAGKHSENQIFCWFHNAPIIAQVASRNHRSDYRISGSFRRKGIAIRRSLTHE